MTAFLLKWSAAVAVVLGLMILGADWETGMLIRLSPIGTRS